jgi:hypothetical protein
VAAGALIELVVYRWFIQFSHVLAFAADQKLTVVRGTRCSATGISIEALDTMDEAMLEQKLQGAINGRRCGLDPIFAQSLQQLVGPDRFVLLPYQFQYPLALRGQASALLGTDYACLFHRCGYASSVVVALRRERCCGERLAHGVLQ